MAVIATILGSAFLMGLIAFFLIGLSSFIFPQLGQIFFGALLVGASIMFAYLKFDAQLYKSKKVSITLSGLLAMSGLLLLLLNFIGLPLSLFGASVLQPITSTPVGSVFGDIGTQVEALGFEPLSFLTLLSVFVLTVGLFIGFQSFVLVKKRGKK